MTIACAVLGAVALFNVIMSVALIRDGGLYPRQKLAQALIVWLLPALGATITLSFMAANHTRAEMRRLVPFPLYLLASKAGNPAGPGVGPGADASAADGWSDCGADAD